MMQCGDGGLLDQARNLPVVFTQSFAAADVTVVRHAARAWIRDDGLAGDATEDFLVAVHELVINAAMHGGGRGVLTLRYGRGVLLAEVVDHGPGFAGTGPPPTTLPGLDSAGGRGLALARMLSDAMTVTEAPEGVTAVVLLRVAGLR